MFGVFLYFGFNGAGIKALITLGFILLTAPVSAHALSRGGHRGGIPLWEKSVIDKYKQDKEGENKDEGS